MTDEVPTPPEVTLSTSSAPTPTPKPVPLTKAQKLEAKAARLRERDAARAAASPASGMRPRALIPWIVAVAVLVLALVGTTLYAVHENSRASDAAAAQRLDQLRDSALKTARTVATSFGTYDYQTLTADFSRTRAYLTPSFAADFGKLTSTLGSLITQAKGQTVGTVQAAGIESISTATAVVLVFLDQKVTSADSTTPRLDHNRLLLTLARQSSGRWLVSKLLLI